MYKLSESVQASCRHCGPGKWHDVVFSVDDHVSSTEPDSHVRSFLIKCGGCKSVSMVEFLVNKKKEKKRNKDCSKLLRSYPTSPKRVVSSRMQCVPDKFKKLVDDIYFAFNEGAYRLCVIGARALFEDILNEHVGDKGGFAQKASELVNNKIITQNQRNVMMDAIDSGSAAIHRAFEPTEEDAAAVLDVAETLIGLVYNLGNLGAKLSMRTPPRKP